jgi:hypothetical protein
MVRQSAISIIFFPNQVNPGNISLVEELMKIFEQQSLIMNFKLKNTKPTFRFRKAN